MADDPLDRPRPVDVTAATPAPFPLRQPGEVTMQGTGWRGNARLRSHSIRRLLAPSAGRPSVRPATDAVNPHLVVKGG